MKRTKDYILSVIIILAAVLVCAVLPTDLEAEIYDDAVRLHVLANSNSEEDQRLKLNIRDRVLEKYSLALSDFDSADEVRAEVGKHLEAIEEDVCKWINEAGYTYTASVTLTEEWYDTRSYGDFTLPRGRYTSLRILLGEAEGENWWCVMYPPLCLDIATEEAPEDDAYMNLTDDEIRLVSGSGYNVRFKFLELLSGVVEHFTKNR